MLTLLEVEFVGHLTVQALDHDLAPLEVQMSLPGPRFGLLVDCRRMTGYDGEARAAFIHWNRTQRERVDRVAVVTTNLLWHMVVSAISLASAQKMKAFGDTSGARAWLVGR